MSEYLTFDGSDFQTDVALGLFGGTSAGAIVRRVAGLGQVDIAVSGVAANDIWPGGGIYPWMTAATSLEVVSASVNDTSAGTGARGVTITGLDASFAEISATVATNGTTPVSVPTQFYRINALSISSAGSGLRNLGQISVRDAGGGTVRGIMPISTVPDLTPANGKGSQYTVPAGHVLLIHEIDLEINMSAGGPVRGADILFYFRSSAPNAPVRLPRALSGTDQSTTALDPKTRLALPAGTDFQLRCAYTSHNGMTISGSWEGNLIRRIP